MLFYLINYPITILFLDINGQNSEKHSLHHSQPKLEPLYSNNPRNASTRLGVFDQLTNYTLDSINELISGSSSRKETIGNVVVNVYHFTQFLFDGNDAYIYSSKKNDENTNEPQKWTFFYVFVVQPIQTSLTLPWVSINKLEVRVRLALGTLDVEDAARQDIARQFNREIAENIHSYELLPR